MFYKKFNCIKRNVYVSVFPLIYNDSMYFLTIINGVFLPLVYLFMSLYNKRRRTLTEVRLHV